MSSKSFPLIGSVDRAAGSIVGHCSAYMRLHVYRKSTATRRYVPGDPSTSFHASPTSPRTLSRSFPPSPTSPPCPSFHHRASHSDNAPSRGATLHAETSRTSSPFRDQPYPRQRNARQPPATSPIAAEPPGSRAHARLGQTRQTDLPDSSRLAICVRRLGEVSAPARLSLLCLRTSSRSVTHS